jgi:hypothetical protein
MKYPGKHVLPRGGRQTYERTPTMKMLKLMALVGLTTAAIPCLKAGQDVSKSVDPKQLEVSTQDAKQIEANDTLKKPAWLTELSVTLKETYDSNVYGSNTNRPGYAPVSNMSSWLTSVTPKLAFDFAQLLDYGKDEEKNVETFALSYAPEVVRYYDAPSENYEAHRIGTQVKGKVDSFSYNLDNSFVFIDGSKDSPHYGAATSAYGTAIARERRDQFQERGKLILRNDWENWFIRGVGTVLYYDLNSTRENPNVAGNAGWVNWVDRYDFNAGADVGYKITKDLAATLGYRRGHQYQEGFSWAASRNDNDYDRIVAGFEGKPFTWMKVELQAGPSFHHYDSNLMAPGHDSEITQTYIDGNVAFEVTSKDTITLRAKQWQWVSSTGTSSYEDKTYEFLYKHKWLKQLTSTIGVMVQDSHYNAPMVRDDWYFTYSAGLKYDLNEWVSFFADYSFSQGKNGVEDNGYTGREFDRQLVTLGVKGQF